MKDRIKKIRKEAGLTQKEFAERLGIKQNTVATYEMGRIGISDAIIISICREFSINEEWLRTGTGEMKREVSPEERYFFNIANLQHTDDETIIRWVNAIAETNPKVLKEIEKFMKKVIGIDEDVDVFESASLERTIDERVASYRCELEAEEKKQGKGA